MLPTHDLRMALRRLPLWGALALLPASAGCHFLFPFVEDTVVVDVILSNGPGLHVTVPLFESRSMGVTLLRLAPGTKIAPTVNVISSDPSIAQVSNVIGSKQMESIEGMHWGIFFGVTGLKPGRAIITASAVGNESLSIPSAEIIVDVVAPNLRVTIAPTALDLTPESSVTLTCSVTNADNGTPVPGARFEWSSSQPAVAAVDQNGTVTGQADGTADITCRVSGSVASATAQVTVGPPPSTPPAAAITGTYHLTGTKTFDECTPGTFPNSLDVDVVAEVTDDAGGATITISSKTEVSGGYRDPWIGTGNGSTILDGEPGILTETIKGQWQSGPVRLSGTVLYRFFIPGFGIDCAAGFDAMFTKR